MQSMHSLKTIVFLAVLFPSIFCVLVCDVDSEMVSLVTDPSNCLFKIP